MRTLNVLPLLVIAAAAAVHAEGSPSTALLPLVAPELMESDRRALEERVRTLAGDAGLNLQAAAATREGLAEAKAVGISCDLEALSCQTRIGVLMGVKQVLAVRVRSDWSEDRVELRLLDALRGVPVREARQQLPKDAARRARVFDGAVLRVVAPERTGTLVVEAPTGASVLVDGVAVDAKAASRLEGLFPGDHDVELQVDGAAPIAKTAAVRAGESTTLSFGSRATAPAPSIAVAPAPQHEGGFAPWLVGGGAIVAGAAGLGAGGLQAALELSAMERGTRDTLRMAGIGLLGATALGVVALGTGAVLMLTGGDS